MIRLPHIRGEWIDRARGFEFTFEGRRVAAYEGDTITSALLASGHRVLGRSFKYHRPRGVLSACGHDANAMMQVRCGDVSIPNVRGDLARVRPGWKVTSVNTRGGLARDRLAILDRVRGFLPVGFYYKAFYSKRWFPFWERRIRALAGLGEVDIRAPRRATPKRYDFCDVLVVGAGPSGLAAALAAAGQGASTLLVDESPALGGSGHYARGASEGVAEQTAALVAGARASSRLRVLTDSYAAGWYSDNWVALAAPECLIKVRARSIVVAQGAYEQPAVFRGNDLPGVMLASGAQRLMYRQAVLVARRVAVVTANAEGYAAALDGIAQGANVVAVVDVRSQPGPASRPWLEQLAARGVAVRTGVTQLEAVAGRDGAVVGLSCGAGTGSQSTAGRLEVDGVWVSVGFAPANALLHQAGARFRYEPAVEQFIPERLPEGMFACGKVNGVYEFDRRVADGRRAGACAAASAGFGSRPESTDSAETPESPTHPYAVFPHAHGREFVDFDEDLELKDIRNAWQEGFDSSELLKRFATLGMGPSQGKLSNMNGLRILARLRGEPVGQVGTTTARPMFHPVPLAHLAGRGFTPERRTAIDADHEALGAVWMPAANWRRPEYYAVNGKSREEAIADEVRAVRTRAGLIDVGTLGKVEVHGPAAAQFLERIYTTRFTTLKQGMTRYGLMLDEAGTIIDDGVIGRLSPELFYFTTTTGNSGTLFNEFGRLSTWWEIPVGLVNLTGHYSAFNLAGPYSRRVLREHTDLDLSDAAFPYLGVRRGSVAGAPCRIMRVGFVGELGYEIHMPAEYATSVWRALMKSGAKFGIQPFGVEAQRMLRLEKGHIIVGQDTDGLTNALEIGAEWAIKMDKPFFVGQRSLRILERAPRRQQLIGFSLAPSGGRRPREGHLILDDAGIGGRVTSVGFSPTLQRCIGLAMVTPDLATRQRLQMRVDQGTIIHAEVMRPPFYDPRGERQRIADPV